MELLFPHRVDFSLMIGNTTKGSLVDWDYIFILFSELTPKPSLTHSRHKSINRLIYCNYAGDNGPFCLNSCAFRIFDTRQGFLNTKICN